jgi:hypothetical protein
VKNTRGGGELVRARLRVGHGKLYGRGSSESCSLGRRICGSCVMLEMTLSQA